MKKYLLKPLLFLITFFQLYEHSVYAQKKVVNPRVYQKDIHPNKIKDLEIPKTNPRDSIIRHLGYSLLYNEKHEQASWVAYQLTKFETTKLFDRENDFRPDPLVKTLTAINSDYEGSGYDKGHLAPAADMGWSEESMSESFYFSNMSPQAPNFNRGIWKKLEELVRYWAIEIDSIYIVTGPVLEDSLLSIGKTNKVSVPKYYYKIILDYSLPKVNGIGFILPNQGSKAPLQEYAVSIDSVEKFTGIDFFYHLPDKKEVAIEKTLCIDCWTWKKEKSNTSNTDNSSESVQCKAYTNSNIRCRNKTKSPNKLCSKHGGN